MSALSSAAPRMSVVALATVALGHGFVRVMMRGSGGESEVVSVRA